MFGGRHRSRSRSRSWSRSRSRSPPRDFKRDLKSNDRSSVPQPCKDFAEGRCRRGDHCPYLHQNSEDRRYSGGGLMTVRPRRDDDASRYTVPDDSREQYPPQIGRSNNNNLCNNFLKGRCLRGESCRYSHHSTVSDDGIVKGSSDESIKARENDRRNRMNNEPPRRSGGDIPCKFFPSGNCRNGKFCRFSHHGLTFDSSDEMSRDDWRRQGNNSSNVDQVREPNLNSDNRSWVHPMENDRAKERDESKYLQLREEKNTGAGMEVSESKGAENWDGDMEISPPQDYRLPSSNNIVVKEDHNEIAKHLNVEAVQPLMPRHSSFQKNPSYSAVSGIDLNSSVSVPPRQTLDLNHQSSSTLFGLNAVGQNQQALAAPYTRMEKNNPNTQSQQLLLDGNTRSFNTVTSEIPSSQNTVSKEQLSQLTNLSASLAQLFGSGQQLPQLYAALNGSNSVDQPNQAIVSQNQYDPLSDSVDLNKPDTSSQPPAPKSVEQKPEIPSQILVSSVELNNKSHQLNKTTDQVAEKVEMVDNENKKGKDRGPAEKIDGDGGGDGNNGRADEGKNGKGMRAFKFALVEFVKELLKPTWKEGQLSKEDHKTIVKKVVDKVTGSIQGVHIPQSQEKIDNYLSSSKPKLSKLVQVCSVSFAFVFLTKCWPAHSVQQLEDGNKTH